jgi:hypothetical protein
MTVSNTLNGTYIARNATTKLHRSANANRKHHRGLGQIAARLWDAVSVRIPVGYEDETGFHYGDQPVTR